MKGSELAAYLLCAALLYSAISGSLAKKSMKNVKKFPHPNQMQGPPGRSFVPPLPLPRNPPFVLPAVTQAPSISDPYACLPRYLCIVENKKGEKRTTIVHGLHPALRKSKPDVIDPSTLPNVKFPGVKKPFPKPRPTISEDSSDEMYRDREFSDSFLKQQEMAEAMAFLEEKRRQFLYQQGLPKQTIIPKGGQKKKPDDEEKPSKESNEDEEKSKEEVSKEEEAEKSVEVSKEDKEEEKSLELSKEEKEDESEKSLELSKEEKEEEDSVEEDGSSENAKSRSKLTKYKLSKKRKSTFKSRMDDYEDVDSLNDHLATVPWDDRLRNDTDPLKPSEIYDKLFRNVLPSFQLPSFPKIAKSIPGMSFLASGSDEEEVTTTTTTTTPRPGLFKRMLNRVTGKGSSPSNPVPSPPIKRRNGRPYRRYKREVSEKLRLISEDAKIVKQIRDPERQCRMIFKGCDLPYDHIMKMVSRGQVLIENDDEAPSTTTAPVVNPTFAQDDEADQAVKDKMSHKKYSKPIPQMLSQSSLGGKKKYGGMNGKNKKPIYASSSEEGSDEGPARPNPKKSVASLPLMPMKYQWGKPTYKVHGKPNGVSDFSGGITERIAYKAPPTTTTTSTTPRPIFAATKLDIRDNLTSPSLQHSVIKVNRTHAVHVLSKKPYNPPKTRTRDAKGQPVSFNSVFTEIAGQTGGIHDFFDRISGSFGGDGTESGREFLSTFPGSSHDIHGNLERFPANPKRAKPAFPSVPNPPTQPPKKVDEDGESDERDEEDSGSEEDQDENKENENGENEEDQDEDGDNEDAADDLPEGSSSPSKKQRPTRPISEQAEHLAFQSENKKPKKSKKPLKEEEQQDDNQQESEEEDEENDEGELDLPDNIPPLIRQSMIQEYKRKQQEEAQGGDGGGGGRPGGPGGQRHDARPGGPHGRPGQRPPPKRQPPRGGGFLSSLFS